MPIKITKAFQWSPNGYDVETVEAGEYESLPERAGEIAAQIGALHVPTDGDVPVAGDAALAETPATPPPAGEAQETPSQSAAPSVDVVPNAPVQGGGDNPNVLSASQAKSVGRRSRRGSGGSNG